MAVMAALAGVPTVLTPSNTPKNAALAADLNSRLFRFVHVPRGMGEGDVDEELAAAVESVWAEAKAALHFSRMPAERELLRRRVDALKARAALNVDFMSLTSSSCCSWEGGGTQGVRTGKEGSEGAGEWLLRASSSSVRHSEICAQVRAYGWACAAR